MARVDTLSFTGDKGTPSGGGGFYTSIVVWESEIQNAYDNTEPYFLDYFADYPSPGNNQGLIILGFNASSEANKVTIRAAPGQECNGVRESRGGTGVRQYTDVSGNRTIRTDDLWLNIEDIELGHDNAVVFEMRNAAGGEKVTFKRCLLNADGIAATSYAVLCNSLPIEVENTTLESAGRGFQQLENATLNFVTSIADSRAFNVFSASTVTNNCVAMAAADPFRVAAGTGSNNASQDTSANFWANSQVNVSTLAATDFVDFPNGDYNYQPGGKLAPPNGVTIAGITTDIANNVRADPPSIGAYGQTAAPGVTFDGPDIVAQTGIEGVLFSFDDNGEGTVASRFTGAVSFALAPTSDPLPAGMSINATTGNPEGTPTETVTFSNTIIEGSDT